MLFSYSYGLKIATLSSKKLGDSYEGTLKNNYLYNDKELFDDADLNWYDYGFRNYDPQIGRFTQLDPLTDSYPFLTPYQYASCDPITNIDIDGLEGGLSTTAETAKTLETAIVRTLPRSSISLIKNFKSVIPNIEIWIKIAQIANVLSPVTTQMVGKNKMLAIDKTNVNHNYVNTSFSKGSSYERPRGGKVFSSEYGHGDGDGPPGEVTKKDGQPINIDGIAATFGGMGKLGHPSKWFETSFTAFEGAHVLHKEGFLGKEEDTNLPDPPLDKKPSFYQQIEVKKFWTYDSTKEQYFFDQGLDTNNVYYIKESGSIKTPDTMVHLKFPTHLRKGH